MLLLVPVATIRAGVVGGLGEVERRRAPRLGRASAIETRRGEDFACCVLTG